jgi:hypothetical protein
MRLRAKASLFFFRKKVSQAKTRDPASPKTQMKKGSGRREEKRMPKAREMAR